MAEGNTTPIKLPSLGPLRPRPDAPQPAAPGPSAYQQRYGAAPPAQPQAARPAAAPQPARPYGSQVGQGNAILVNGNQQGNPLLACLRNVNYRHAEVLPDYQINDRVRLSCVLAPAAS